MTHHWAILPSPDCTPDGPDPEPYPTAEEAQADLRQAIKEAIVLEDLSGSAAGAGSVYAVMWGPIDRAIARAQWAAVREALRECDCTCARCHLLAVAEQHLDEEGT